MEKKGAYPELEILTASLLHPDLCPLSVLAEVHLDKGMPLVLVDDASLDLTETAKDLPKFHFGATADN